MRGCGRESKEANFYPPRQSLTTALPDAWSGAAWFSLAPFPPPHHAIVSVPRPDLEASGPAVSVALGQSHPLILVLRTGINEGSPLFFKD